MEQHIINDDEAAMMMELFSTYLSDCTNGTHAAQLLCDWLYIPVGASITLMNINQTPLETKWDSVSEMLDQMIAQLEDFKMVTTKLRKAELSGQHVTPDDVHRPTEH